MERPTLDRSLSPEEFGRWYWLKQELLLFCRAHGLPTGGGKQELAAQIGRFLEGRPATVTTGPRSRAARMPEGFTPDTTIGAGWRCSQGLRDFFVSHHGPGFRFNGALREFIATQSGRTLADALAHYRESLEAPPPPISEQFEYNRHTRAFYAAYPDATRADVIAAWWALRGGRKGEPGD